MLMINVRSVFDMYSSYLNMIAMHSYIYQKLSCSITVSKKEGMEEIVFDLEFDKQLAENNDWKRLENWHIGRKNFIIKLRINQ